MGLFILYFIKSVLLCILMEMPVVKTTSKWINVKCLIFKKRVWEKT